MSMFVEEFKARLDGGGTRTNLFRATIVLQGGPQVPEKTSFLCKAASIPPSDVATIEVPFRGRVVKVAGDRTFQPWNVTIINDVDFAVRAVMEQWHSQNLNSHTENIGDQKPLSYKSDMMVDQLDKEGSTLRTYKFVGCWIQNIGEIALSYDNANQIGEFPVVIEYDYWTAEGNGGTVR